MYSYAYFSHMRVQDEIVMSIHCRERETASQEVDDGKCMSTTLGFNKNYVLGENVETSLCTILICKIL